MYFIMFLVVCLLSGVVGVAANPSPFYGIIGLVIGAFAGCSLLVSLGGSFVGLILFLVYLGGMLVVFAYSVAMAADAYPASWVDYSVLVYVVGYWGLLLLLGWGLGLEFVGGVGVGTVDCGGGIVVRADFVGVAALYSEGGLLLVFCGWGLFLTLFVVLEIARGRAWGGLRVP